MLRTACVLAMLTVTAASASVLAAEAPANNTPTSNNSGKVTWSKDVFPILQNKCVSCHSDLSQKGGLNLENSSGVMKGGAKRGPCVVPGRPEKSPLLYLCDGSTQPIMPPKGKRLTAEQLVTIKTWIADGAKFDAEATITLDRPNWITPHVASAPALAVALDSLGARLAIGRANAVELWDVDSAKRLAVLTGPRDYVQCLAFSPDDKTLAVGEFERVLLYNVGGLQEPAPHPQTPTAELGDQQDRVTALAFSADGKTLVTASGLPVKSGVLTVWEMPTGKRLRSFDVHSDCVYGMALSVDGQLVATASADKLAKIHEVATGRMIKSFSGHTDHVLAVAFAADGKSLFTGGADKIVKMWNIVTGEKTKDAAGHTRPITGMVFRPDGKGFFTCSGDRSVREWNIGGNPARNFPAVSEYAHCLAISTDTGRLAVGAQDGQVKVYGLATGTAFRDFGRDTPPEPAPGTKLPPAPPSPGKPTVVAVAPSIAPPVPPKMTGPAKPPAIVPGVVVLPAHANGWRYAAASAVGATKWTEPAFDDAKWLKGKAPLGYGEDVFAEKKGTVLDLIGQDIYFRYELTVDEKMLKAAQAIRLLVCSDNCAVVYINGKLADEENDDHEYAYWNRMVELPVDMLRPGKNIIAVHLVNTEGSSDAVMDLQLELVPAGK